MRWDALFADLEAQLEALERAADDAEVGDRARHEWSTIRLAERLRGAAAGAGQELAVGVRGAGTLSGRPARIGPDWLLLDPVAPGGPEALVPLAAVTWVTGLGATSARFRPGEPAARLGLGYALRELARRRLPVRATLVDGTALAGTWDRVGADWAELAEHDPAEPRRAAAVGRTRVVPWHALAVVRSG